MARAAIRLCHEKGDDRMMMMMMMMMTMMTMMMMMVMMTMMMMIMMMMIGKGKGRRDHMMLINMQQRPKII